MRPWGARRLPAAAWRKKRTLALIRGRIISPKSFKHQRPNPSSPPFAKGGIPRFGKEGKGRF
jgi:hypothetical protein